METNPDAPAAPESSLGTLPGNPTDPFIGREIAGKYRVTRRLGAGGMGAVYRAVHLTTDGDVAIKFLHGTAVGDENAIRRFQLEAQNVAALRHANTVRVVDFGVDQSTFYLVMEFLDGHPLSDLLLNDGPLPWPRAVHILRQILKSLWEAHEHPKRIIHRDIKPANIFVVDLPGDADHVRVVDFGIARALEGSGASTQGLLGTPFYMAPELWRGEAVDARTDLYALGCVAYQCLAGAPPFVPPPSATDSLYPLLAMHLNDRPPSLRDTRPTVPVPIADWVEHLLAKEPSRRPASARVALEALDVAARASERRVPSPVLPDAMVPDTMVAPEPPRPVAPVVTPVVVPVVAPAVARVAGPVVRPARQAAAPQRGLAAWIIVLIVFGSIAIVVALVLVGSSTAELTPATQASLELDDGEPDPADPPLFPVTPAVAVGSSHPTYGALMMSYRTRLSARDHLDEDGASLDDAAAVVTLDRIRYHAGVGDPEDGSEDAFVLEAAQTQLYQLVAQILDEPMRRAILEGHPLVELAFYERGLTLRVVAE